MKTKVQRKKQCQLCLNHRVLKRDKRLNMAICRDCAKEIKKQALP